MKSYPYGNASREKTVKAARLKKFEIIDKSLSELLKKTANQKKVWFLSFIDSKKRIFRRRRANGVAPTVLLQMLISPPILRYSFFLQIYITGAPII
jgi:hypothetical protein